MAQSVTITNENAISLVNHGNDLEEEEENITFDTVLRHVGEFGKFQKILYLMFSVPYVATAMQLLGWVFVGTIPNHDCPSEKNANYSNITFDTTHVTSSATMEWHLVCGNSSLHASVGAAPMVSKSNIYLFLKFNSKCFSFFPNLPDPLRYYSYNSAFR